MSEPRDLRDLVGEDVTAEELAELAAVHALLRSVPPPPEVPEALTRRVVDSVRPSTGWGRRRIATAVALAAALSALAFGLGTQFGGDDFDTRVTVPLRATADARGASGELHVGKRTGDGNWGLEVEVEGLPRLPEGGYYVLWLAKNGEYAATCGTFSVGEDGSAAVSMNASYRLADYDAWVITARVPGQAPDAEPPWLLTAEI